MNKLRAALERHDNLLFPLDAEDDELSIIHAELVDYDGFVVGLIKRVLLGEAGAIGKLRYERGLERRLDEIIAGDVKSEIGLAKEYKQYLDSVHSLITLASASS